MCHILFSDELNYTTLVQLYNLTSFNDVIIIGNPSLKVYRAVSALAKYIDVLTNKSIYLNKVKTIDLQSTIISNKSPKEIFSQLQLSNINSLNFKIKNYNNEEQVFFKGINPEAVILAKSKNIFWTDIFKNVNTHIRVLVSSDVYCRFLNGPSHVDIYFDNEELLPNNLIQFRHNNYYSFDLESEELKSVERRFIRGTTININQIDIYGDFNHLEINSPCESNSIFIDSQEYLDLNLIEILNKIIDNKLNRIYYTDLTLESRFEELGILTITRRWEN